MSQVEGHKGDQLKAGGQYLFSYGRHVFSGGNFQTCQISAQGCSGIRLKHQIRCILNQAGIPAQGTDPPVDGGMLHHWFLAAPMVRFYLVRQRAGIYQPAIGTKRILYIGLTECQDSGQGIAFVRKGKVGVVCCCFVAAWALPAQQQSFLGFHSLFYNQVKYAFTLFVPFEQARFNPATRAIRQSAGHKTLIYQMRVMSNLLFSC